MVITCTDSPYRPTNHINHQNWDIFHSSISKISSYPTASRKKICAYSKIMVDLINCHIDSLTKY